MENLTERELRAYDHVMDIYEAPSKSQPQGMAQIRELTPAEKVDVGLELSGRITRGALSVLRFLPWIGRRVDNYLIGVTTMFLQRMQIAEVALRNFRIPEASTPSSGTVQQPPPSPLPLDDDRSQPSLPPPLSSSSDELQPILSPPPSPPPSLPDLGQRQASPPPSSSSGLSASQPPPPLSPVVHSLSPPSGPPSPQRDLPDLPSTILPPPSPPHSAPLNSSSLLPSSTSSATSSNAPYVYSSREEMVHKAICYCVEDVERNLNSKNIFRQSSVNDEGIAIIMKTFSRFSETTNVQFEELLKNSSGKRGYFAANLLKEILRGDPPITQDLLNSCLEIGRKEKERTTTIEEVRNLVARLPEDKSRLLAYVIELAKAVSDPNQKNEMSAFGLGQVLYLVLYQLPTQPPYYGAGEDLARLIRFMIENYDKIFKVYYEE